MLSCRLSGYVSSYGMGLCRQNSYRHCTSKPTCYKPGCRNRYKDRCHSTCHKVSVKYFKFGYATLHEGRPGPGNYIYEG